MINVGVDIILSEVKFLIFLLLSDIDFCKDKFEEFKVIELLI